MYCKLLDEVMKEMQGNKVYINEEKEDVQIDLNISSYIPDEYIENSDMKISIYQEISLCKNEDEILDVTDEIIDRFGSMPNEVENLLEIARIKNMCKEKQISKISQRPNGIVFYFSASDFAVENVNKIIEKFKTKVKFSPSALPYITYKIDEKMPILKGVKDFLREI